MAKKSSPARKDTGLGPSIEQIICWCATYNVHLERDPNKVRAVTYDVRGYPITSIVLNRVARPLPSQEDDLKRAIAICDMVADELCLLKPSVAWKLNQ